MNIRIARSIAGGLLALALVGCSGGATSSGSTARPTTAVASSASSASLGPVGSASALASPSAGPGATAATSPAGSVAGPTTAPSLPGMFSNHSDPSLEALLPTQVGGVALTKYSLTLDELIEAGDTDLAEVASFLASLKKTTADASVAGAYDPTSTLSGGIQAFRIAGADAELLLAGIVALTKSDIGTDAVVSQATVGGRDVTVVSAGDGPNDTQWVHGRGDVVFTVLGADEATAAMFLAALP